MTKPGLAIFAALLLSGCNTWQGLSLDLFGPRTSGAAIGTPGGAVAGLPAAIHRAAEAAWSTRDYGAAASHYGVLYQREPENLQFAVRYAEAARRSGDPRAAADVLDALLGRGAGGAPLLIELAKANLQLGRPAEALAAAQQAVAREPGSGEAQVVLGLSLDAVGDHSSAVFAYQEALAKGAPGTARILNNLALSLAQTGRLNESVDTLRKASRLDSEAPPIAENLRLMEEIASNGPTAASKPPRIASGAAVRSGSPEKRTVVTRGVTLSDAHRRLPPQPGTAEAAPVYSPGALRLTAPAAVQPGDPPGPDLNDVATTLARMRSRMDSLALPVRAAPQTP